MTANGSEVSFWDDGNVLESEMRVAWLGGYTKKC